MSNTKNQHQDPEVAIATAINKTEGFIERNSRTLYGAVIAIVIVAAAYFGWKYLYAGPRADKASDMLFVAEQQFQAEEYQTALDGDGNNAGFLEVIEKYGSTPQGNLARHYAAICYIKLDKPEEAISMLDAYSHTSGIPNVVINAQNYGLRGDLLVQKEDYKGALEMYRKAVDQAANPFTTPYYLKKAGMVCEKLGDNAGAVLFYNRIKDEFGASMEARDIDKSIGRAEQ